MPFQSIKQMRFMYAKHPDIAARWTAEQKRKKQPVVKMSPDPSELHVIGNSGQRKGRLVKLPPMIRRVQ